MINGKKFLEENQNFVEIHRHHEYQITLEDYYKATKNDNYKRKFNDIAWGIFNERTLIYEKNKEYIHLRFNYFYMASLLVSEEKYEQALRLYLKCLIFDLSGLESYEEIKKYKEGWFDKKELINRLNILWFHKGSIESVLSLKEYYSEKMLYDVYNETYIPFNVSTVEFISKLLNDAFNTAVFDYDKYKKELILNKKKKYLEMIQ